MNEPTVSDQTNRRFAEAVRDYAPAVPRKWQQLLALKPGITELRHKGASYRAIADILRATDVPVSRTTVARFCRDVLQPSHLRQQTCPASRKLPAHPPRTAGPSVNAGGPRIANKR